MVSLLPILSFSLLLFNNYMALSSLDIFHLNGIIIIASHVGCQVS